MAQQTAIATARAARAAAHAARTAAIATAHAIKVAAKATAAAVKAIIAATKALIAAIAAGGWIAVLVVIVICLIGMIIGSCFGIFFSGEDSGTGQTMQTAVQEINTDYQDRLDEIKASHSYDVLEMSGSRAVWKEVLAVYAVKTTTDPDAAQEVATMDDTKKQLLKDIFWKMNEISSNTDTKTETVIETSDDGNGNIVETETTVTQTYLYITVSHKTAEEMADQFGFNEDQREQMAELLADENNSLWSQVLYGISGGDGEIVTVALSQVGNVGGEPYWSWYGFNSRVEWCACFVSWCANECGYIEAGVIPKFAACASQGVPWFQERGLWQDNSYEPRPGDIIFSIGMMAARMVLPIMLALWRRWRMDASTPSKATPAIVAVKTVTRLVTMKSMGMELRHINSHKKDPAETGWVHKGIIKFIIAQWLIAFSL